MNTRDTGYVADAGDVIIYFVEQARHRTEALHFEVNGVRLVADPAVIAVRPSYVSELQWTHYMAAYHGAMLDVLGARTEYPNLIPELERHMQLLLEELDELQLANVHDALGWLIRLAPVVYCWILTEQHIDAIRRRFETCSGGYEDWSSTSMLPLPAGPRQLEDGQHLVRLGLLGLDGIKLDSVWLTAAQLWRAA